MNQLGWIDFSPTHRDKVMLVMDMFREQGVIDELGIGTIRDTISDILFPGTSTIQTRVKYFLLIPWIIHDIEQRGRIDRFQSELEELEVHFIKVLRSKPNSGGIIGATLRNANPKRKPSSIYWNGLRTYGILNFKGSISEYANYQKHFVKKQQAAKKQLIDPGESMEGDDRDANHLYQQNLWTSLPKPNENWKEDITIELTADEAAFLRERIIRSNPGSLWAFTLNHCAEDARNFKSIEDFLSVGGLPEGLQDIIRLAADFNSIMKGALIRYNLLIQMNRENGKEKELFPLWKRYWDEMRAFDWNNWSTEKLWHYCPFITSSTRKFVERWIGFVQAEPFNQPAADQLIKERELKLKGLRRARLSDKAIAQKQESLTGITVFEDGTVSYLTFRWNNVRTFLNDIQNGLQRHVTTE